MVRRFSTDSYRRTFRSRKKKVREQYSGAREIFRNLAADEDRYSADLLVKVERSVLDHELDSFH